MGLHAEPELLGPGPTSLVESASRAGAVVAGLSERRGSDGLGAIRHALVRDAPVPVLLVSNGLRPSALAPRETITRFTWSMTELQSE